MTVSKSKKKPPETTLFFNIFVGEFVELTTKLYIKAMIDSDEGHTVQEMPVTIQGYLLDQDEKYFYIGDGPGAIETAVEIPTVAAITIVKQKGPLDQIFDSMPNPSDEEMN